MQYYCDQFEGKSVYCNCDNPKNSNFFKYFVDNFHRLRLKKLICTWYNPDYESFAQQAQTGVYAEYSGNINSDGRPDIKSRSLNSNGDFRSDECVNILLTSDIVVTNPPFSLFRDFIALIVKFNKQFLVIGNINAITYKEIFQLIQNNKAWLGKNLGRGISGFIVPDSYELFGTETRTDDKGNKIISTNNCLWLTNLSTPTRSQELSLTKRYIGNETEYPFFDNCHGINVNKTQDIPQDYYGIMGVPITFLHKYNPAQFKIIRFRKGDDGRDLKINGKCPYFRILIQRITNNDLPMLNSPTFSDFSSSQTQKGYYKSLFDDL